MVRLMRLLYPEELSMKYIMYLSGAVWLSGSLYADPISVGCNDDDNCFSMEFVHDVQRRSFMTMRLKGPVGLLLRWSKLHGAKRSGETKVPLLDRGITHCFEHEEVKLCVQMIEESDSIVPFYKLWTSCLSYKYLDSDTFMREIITVILMLYKSVLISNLQGAEREDLLVRADHYCAKLLESGSPKAQMHEAQQLISDMSRSLYKTDMALTELYHHYSDTLKDIPSYRDGLIGYGQAGNIKDSFTVIAHLLDESNDVSDFVIDNNVRFYLIHRMLKSLYLLSRASSGDHSVMHCCDFASCLHDEFFHHAYVHACALEIKKQNSIKPIFVLWEHMVSYDFIEDDIFMKDFIGLVMYVCQYLCVPIEREGRSLVAFNEMLAMYEKIESLPLAELLDLLDVVVDQFGDVVEQYELNGTLTWSAWIAKYWWAPPILSGAFVYTVMSSSFWLKMAEVFKKWGTKTA